MLKASHLFRADVEIGLYRFRKLRWLMKKQFSWLKKVGLESILETKILGNLVQNWFEK